MNKSLLVICSAIAIVVIFQASTTAPKELTHAAGYAGGGTGCSCHGSVVTSSNISISGIPANTIAGQSYPMSYTISNPSGVRFGMDISVGTSGGKFSTTNKYAKLASASKTYEIIHSNPPVVTGGTYTYDNITWTAPATASTVTFKFCGICGKAATGSGSAANYKNTFATSVTVVTPVKLISFNAVQSTSKIFLDWTTASELNVADFVVERSEEGIYYSSIGSKVAVGNTLKEQHYHFEDDASTLTGTVYYRLKSVDKDGSFSYSNVSAINLKSSKNYITAIYPNPLIGGQNLKVKYVALKADKVTFSLFNIIGNKVSNATFNINEGSNDLSLNVGHLAPGTYYLMSNSSISGIQKQVVMVQ